MRRIMPLLLCCLALYGTGVLFAPHAAASTHPAIAATDTSAAAVYKRNCSSCHDRGIMGAPEPGAPRLLEDIDILVENAINGIGNMPARGHATFLSDEEIRAVVEYMRQPH